LTSAAISQLIAAAPDETLGIFDAILIGVDGAVASLVVVGPNVPFLVHFEFSFN
jgi:hypothetical protein